MKQAYSDTYFIRPDYVHRIESTTLEHDSSGSYWTRERIATALSYQYDVYRIAYEIADQRGGRVRLLDVGCGPAGKHNLFSSKAAVEITLVDQPSVKNVARQQLPNAKFHAVNLESPDLNLETKFDIVLCADVIEHLVNPKPCVEFIKAHTKPDGVALISTPERDPLYGPNKLESGHPCHIREWNYEEFSAYVDSCGFQIQKHIILDQQRQEHTHGVRGVLRKLTDRLGFHDPSFSCQLVVCRVGAR